MSREDCQTAAVGWLHLLGHEGEYVAAHESLNSNEALFWLHEVHNGFMVEGSAMVTVHRHAGQLIKATLPATYNDLDYSACYEPRVSEAEARQAFIAAYNRYHPYASARFTGPHKIAGYSELRATNEFTAAQVADLTAGRALPYYRFVVWDDGGAGLQQGDSLGIQFWDVDARTGHATAVSVIPMAARGPDAPELDAEPMPESITVAGVEGELTPLGPTAIETEGRPVVVAEQGGRLLSFYWIAEKWLLVSEVAGARFAFKPAFELLRPLMRSAEMPGSFQIPARGD